MANEPIVTTNQLLEEKSFLVSKRIWLNIISIASAIILRFSGYKVTEDDTEMIMLCIAGLNILLTFLSEKKIVMVVDKNKGGGFV